VSPEAAISLLRSAVKPLPGQLWYDLGAGKGTFTRALASLLGNQSEIVAIDIEAAAMDHIPQAIDNIKITKREADLSREAFVGPHADGIIMANFLHFMANKLPMLKTLKGVLKPNGVLIIIEYEMNKGNEWVPFPINYASLAGLGLTAGYKSVEMLEVAESKYNKEGMYAAALRGG
jgi:ubiquinone/menaquinone biosynthesis C-methylase UbiE